MIVTWGLECRSSSEEQQSNFFLSAHEFVEQSGLNVNTEDSLFVEQSGLNVNTEDSLFCDEQQHGWCKDNQSVDAGNRDV